MQLRHGGLAISLPDDWRDESQLVFVGPVVGAPFRPGALESANESVAVRISRRADSPEALLADQAESLSALDIGYMRLDEGTLKSRLGEGPYYVQRFELEGELVTQLVVLLPIGPFLVQATASASAERFDNVRSRLTQILESLDVVPA